MITYDLKRSFIAGEVERFGKDLQAQVVNKVNEVYENIADQVEGFGDQVTGFGEDVKTKVEIELSRIYGGKCTLSSSGSNKVRT